MTPLAWDRTHIWHPYASLGNPPPVLLAKRASGVEIELDDGQRLVDAVSSWWCVAHGHNHPALVEAIRRQSERLSHVMFGGFTHEPAIALAEKLAAFAPPGLDRVFFAWVTCLIQGDSSWKRLIKPHKRTASHDAV